MRRYTADQYAFSEASSKQCNSICCTSFESPIHRWIRTGIWSFIYNISSHKDYSSLGRGEPHSVHFSCCHICCMRILAVTTNGAIHPNGSNNFEISDKTFRFVHTFGGADSLDLNVKESVVGCHEMPSVFTVDSKSSSISRSLFGTSLRISSWLAFHFRRLKPY